MKHFLFLATFLFLQVWTAEAIVLDRILAVVNGEIISLSEVESGLIFFDQVKPIQEKGFSDSLIRTGIQNLIDHKLLLAEAKRFDVEVPTEEEMNQKLEEIQRRFNNPGEFEKALRQNVITLEDLRQKIAEHLIVDRFIEQRIRFFAIVLPDEIARYYAEHQADFQGKPLEEVEKDIETILLEEKEKAKLEDYLKKLRSKASIQINF
jgi:peptidyl-prolyl cis-trans isomerase SurA